MSLLSQKKSPERFPLGKKFEAIFKFGLFFTFFAKNEEQKYIGLMKENSVFDIFFDIILSAANMLIY